MTTQEIVSKLWNLCNVLRDDGITYHQYVTELTYILFLKMAKETGAESQIPAAYRWDELTAKSGIELKKFYKELLTHLGENCTGRVRQIYRDIPPHPLYWGPYKNTRFCGERRDSKMNELCHFGEASDMELGSTR